MLFLIAENVVFMGISSFFSVILILLLANFLATHIYKTSLPVYKINSHFYKNYCFYKSSKIVHLALGDAVESIQRVSLSF